MAADIGTLSSVLKEFYLGPIIEQLNQETFVLDMFEKGSFDWNGRLVHIPIHVSRNTGVAFSSAGTLPSAGEQGYEDLTVTAQNLYGRFQIDGPAISALGKGTTNSFVNYVDAEMTTLKDDVRNASNQACISGGTVIGYLSQANTVSAGQDDWMFDGDFAKVQALITLNAGPVAVQPVRMDTYDAVGVPIDLSAVDPTFGSVTLDAALTTPAGTICAVVVTEAGLLTALNSEPIGIYGNLSTQTHFGVIRSDAVAAAQVPPVAAVTSLRSNFISTVADGAGGAPPAPGTDRVAMDLDVHFQGMLDTVNVEAGSEPDCIFASPLQRSRYAGLVAGVIQADFAGRGGDKKADGGFNGFAYAGIPIKTSRHIGNGHLIFLETKVWKMAELEPMGFADLDGAILSRVSGSDSWEGFTRWYYNQVCVAPNRNGLVTGLTL